VILAPTDLRDLTGKQKGPASAAISTSATGAWLLGGGLGNDRRNHIPTNALQLRL
jgi:hypothetical protein